jgi:hypothetical protein
MINQMNQRADAEPRNDAVSLDLLKSSKNVEGKTLPSSQPEQSTAPRNLMRVADVQALEAYVERRRKLAARIRLENPTRTEEEIEARLEQFGA